MKAKSREIHIQAKNNCESCEQFILLFLLTEWQVDVAACGIVHIVVHNLAESSTVKSISSADVIRGTPQHFLFVLIERSY